MQFEEFEKLKVGGQCVIIQTGELGRVLEINRNTSGVYVVARRAGMGVVRQWFNYTYLAKL